MSSYLPQALGATGVVVAGPVIAVWGLRAAQLVGSTALAVGIGVLMSLAASFAGSAYWANRESSRDVLFSELMIWGWLRRWRAERKLTAVLERLPHLPKADRAQQSTPQLSMLTELAAALEAGDPYTRGHSRRVARYAVMIAERMGLAPEEVDRLRTAAVLHDVGKVQTPIEILHKPGRLTDEEYSIVKAHPVDGARLVEALGDEQLTAIVRHHHERLDGRGYPSGLRGDEIPLGARIVAVADTFDAITSARPYRPPSPHRKALDILIKEAGTQLDADAVRAFRACYTGLRPFALWMTLLAFPQRVGASLGNGTTASAVSITKVVAAASTVAVVGGAAASAAPLIPSSSRSTIHGSTRGVFPAPRPVVAVAASHAPAVSHALASDSPGARLTLAARPPATVHAMARRGDRAARRFPHTAASGSGTGRSSHARSGQATPSAPPSTTAPAPVSTVAAAPTPTSVPVSSGTNGSSTRGGKGRGKGSSPAGTPAHGSPSKSGWGKASGGWGKASGGSGKASGGPGKAGGGSGKAGGGSGSAGGGSGSATKGGIGSGNTKGSGGSGKAAGTGSGNAKAGGTGSGTTNAGGGTGNAGGNGGGNGATVSAGNGGGNGGKGQGTSSATFAAAPAPGTGTGNGSGGAGNGNGGTGNGGTGTGGTGTGGAGTGGSGTTAGNGNAGGAGSSGTGNGATNHTGP